jgi:hypothetical protein
MKEALREWIYSSTIFDLGIIWRWVVSFTPLPLYRPPSQGKSPEYPLDRGLGKYKGWSEAVVKRKMSCPCSCRELNPRLLAITTEISRFILSRVGYVTRQTTLCESRIQLIFNEHSLLHTVQSLSLNSIPWLLFLVRCFYFGGYFQTVLLRMYCLLICLRPLLRIEPFVIAVEAPVELQ